MKSFFGEERQVEQQGVIEAGARVQHPCRACGHLGEQPGEFNAPLVESQTVAVRQARTRCEARD